MSTQEYYRALAEETGWILAKRGFYLLGFAYLLIIPDILIGHTHVRMISTAIMIFSFIISLLGVYNLYEASKILQQYKPLIGEPLHKASYYLILAVILIFISPLAGFIGLIFIFISFFLVLASLYYFFLYASWIEQKVGPRSLAIVYVIGIILAQLLLLGHVSGILEIMGAGLGAGLNALLGSKTKECMYICGGRSDS